MIYRLFSFLIICLLLGSCATPSEKEETNTKETVSISEDKFQWQVDRFDDKRILRYKINGFDQLTLKQKELVYYLTQAGLAGRDIMFDMNYRHNIEIKKAFDKILSSKKEGADKTEWSYFIEYVKNFYFSSGIHHHYSMDKFIPKFSKDFFDKICSINGVTLSDNAINAIFNPQIDNKKVNLDPEKGLVKASAVNFYDPDITESEVDAYYSKISNKSTDKPLSYGLNSKMIKVNGVIKEDVYKVGGKYGAAISNIVTWLEKAVLVAENKKQAEALKLLINFYKTGDLQTWDDYNVAWVSATEGDIDYINGFVEVYNDSKGYRGSYEMIVQIKDFEASERMSKVASHAKYFEEQSTIMDEHKKEDVVGISYNVVVVAGEAGDASPSTPIGVNLPNANWIRAKHGSKSVSLGNIIEAYEKAEGSGLVGEFANDKDQIRMAKEYGSLAGKFSTALHEVIGHASGKLEKGVLTPKETLRSYYSTLEEARADLVALYYITDPILLEWGLIPSEDVGKAEYDQFMMNGLMTQLIRITPGKDIEESHMRNRQMIANWVYEKGKKQNVVELIKRDNKTYVEIQDYNKLRKLFGKLLREVQRVKSQGDYNAGKSLVETYGVKVNENLHAEVLARTKKLNIAPYSGFVNPNINPQLDDNNKLKDFKVEYPSDFLQQMVDYSALHSSL